MQELEDRANEPGVYGVRYRAAVSKNPLDVRTYSGRILAVSWADAQRQANELGMELDGRIVGEGPFEFPEQLNF